MNPEYLRMLRAFFRFCLAAALLNLTAFAAARPNIIVILSDDMGYSDLGCYGGEIRTPNLDRLAANGVRFTQFYNTARCCPTRASLLTGLYPHQAGVGHMIEDKGKEGFAGELNRKCVTIPEVLKTAGYRNYMVGKWHVARNLKNDGPKYDWPLQRGFDRYYGTITGAGSYFDPGTLTRDNTLISPFADPEYRPDSYYYTDAISDHAVRFINEHQRDQAGKPFFLYVAFTAAHWPLHAKEADVAKYRTQYDGGYEPARQARLARLRQMGLIDSKWEPTPSVGDWAAVTNKAWESRCMEVYAAMVDSMDQGIGRIVGTLEQNKMLDDTLILFLQDNGGCAELLGRGTNMARALQPSLPPIAREALRADVRPNQTRDGFPMLSGRQVMPGTADTFISYGREWAHVSNTPFREYKHWVHEGGIATPLIAHWPKGMAETMKNRLVQAPGHLVDIMATCVDVAGAKYPAEVAGNAIRPLEGVSLRPALAGQPLARTNPLFWEHEGNRAIRAGKWKLVAKGPKGLWELYDMEADRTELHDLAVGQPERVKELVAQWEAWANRAHVLPWISRPPYGQKPTPADAIHFDLETGDDLSGEDAPNVLNQSLLITAEILEMTGDGVILAQGGSAQGYSLYVKGGKLNFATRHQNKLTVVTADEPLGKEPVTVTARLAKDGKVILKARERVLGEGKTPGPLRKQPMDGLQVGEDQNGLVGNYDASFQFQGKLGKVTLDLGK